MTDNGPVNGNEQYSYQVTGQTANSYPGGSGGSPSTDGFKVTVGSWATTWPGNNLYVMYDASGDATIYFYPGTFSDGWLPLQNRVGFADPGNMAWEVTGDFGPNWGSDPNAQMTLDASSVGVYTNIYIVATPGTYNLQFRTPGTWNLTHFGSDFGNGSGNASFTTTTANQAVLFQLDLPNGRFQAGNPVQTCLVSFNVDMTVVAGQDPAFSHVTVNGDNIGNWSDVACTNNPTPTNPYVYTAVIPVVVGKTVQYQFRYLNGDGQTVYDALGGISGHNRSVVVPNLASTNLPAVYFDDASPNPNDYLPMETTVTFSVNMTNAMGYTNGILEHVFDPNADFVVINGDWIPWLTWGGNPIQWAPYTLTQDPSGELIYTWTTTFPQGHSRGVTYLYGINGNADEAGFAQNHFRYIRSSNGTYNMPLDTFGNQYQEPKVGGLAIGSPSGGSFPIYWLSYPNVNLQSSSDLMSWQDVPNTTGASSITWTMSSSNQFFRLIQP